MDSASFETGRMDTLNGFGGYSLPLTDEHGPKAFDRSSNPLLINEGKNFGTNCHMATSSRPSPCRTNKKSYKLYDPIEEETLVLAVAKYGREWKKIANMHFEGTGRTDDNLKQKWKDMMNKADTEMASPHIMKKADTEMMKKADVEMASSHMMKKADTEMASYKRKVLHILASVVQVAVQKESIYNATFREWFETMGEEDKKIKHYAEQLVLLVKKKNLPKGLLNRKLVGSIV